MKSGILTKKIVISILVVYTLSWLNKRIALIFVKILSLVDELDRLFCPFQQNTVLYREEHVDMNTCPVCCPISRGTR